MDVTIRPFRQEDAEQASAVMQAAIQSSECYLQPVRDLLKAMNTPEKIVKRSSYRKFFVAEADEKVCGTIGLQDNELRNMFVHPECQGKGIGRKLYQRVKEEAMKRGLKKLILHSTPGAVPVYERFGFKKIRTIYKERKGLKYPLIQMEQKL